MGFLRGTDKGNETCTEKDCSLISLLDEGHKHYRWQCGSDHVEGYGNTDEEKSSESKGSSRWSNLMGGWG